MPVDGEFDSNEVMKSLINLTHGDLFYFNSLMCNFSSSRQLMVIYFALII